MNWHRYIAFLTWLLGVFPWTGRAQETEQFPSIQPASVTAYDLEDGLPMTCTESVYEDPTGRLWLNPCRIQDIHQELGFYMFDGKRSYQVPIKTKDGQIPNTIWFTNKG